MNLKQIGEFGLIERIKSGFGAPEGMTGIGDDCAIIPQLSGLDTLVSTDMLVEGTHFLSCGITPYQLGWKSAAVNISDIAAMGGRPTATFLALALPSDISDRWMDEFIRGYGDISGRYGCPLLGGDTTGSGERICICVTVLGQVPSGTAHRRDTARAGDLVCVTGPLGDSSAGLKIILDGAPGDSASETLIRRHCMPEPRVDEGIELASCPGVHAMMDISDGISSDLRHILASSGKGAIIDTRTLPMSQDFMTVCSRRRWDPLELAVSGGEDYELLFTIDPESEKSLRTKHHTIGRITRPEEVSGTDGIVWAGCDRKFRNFNHFK